MTSDFRRRRRSAARTVRGPWATVLRTPLGATGAGLILAFVVLALLAPMVWGDAATRIDVHGTAGVHLLGTDALGRDVLARVLVASRLSISLTLLATVIGLTLGIVLGAAPSVLGRRGGRAVIAAINLAVAFPGLLLVLFFAVVFGVGVRGAVLAIGLAMAPSFGRLTHTLAASVAGRDYVAAARLAGAGRLRLLFRHILPNIAEPLVVNATISAGGALLTFSGLSFLGIGVQAPSYDWGRLLNEGLNKIYTQPAAALAPGVAVVLAGLGFSIFGEMAAKVLGGNVARPHRDTAGDTAAADALAGRQPTAAAGEEVLVVESLRVRIPGPAGWVTPVQDVTFSIRPGEIVGLVGESGSGKSLTAMATAQLLEAPVAASAARLDFLGESLLTGRRSGHRTLLGTTMALVFQDPMSSLNPSKLVGRQLAEVAEVHAGANRRDAMALAVERLGSVRLPRPGLRARQYPHELSGGMRQRAMIGMGLMGTPRLVIADEPTTALDATVQQQILHLFQEIRDEHGTAILLISHDLAVVEQICDRLLVMYAGRVVEELPARALEDARHPYTRALFSAVPQLDADRTAPLAVIDGAPPDSGAVVAGCAFADRCRVATDRCRTDGPALAQHDGDGAVACWYPQSEPITLTRRPV
ncbi:dipeptide/oligopeptide/nickel ABC transporter permease/ATP-binding protein [Kribbella solani]|uniref:Oligopeptide/dipeptide ABC transporter ATP-binding protein n=1 Tax=Kribbella solani TaxID=236067 RepID=A0A841DP88_9ACTN|nr:dipeptide/oligopeptide/nickel ABC transporter permease/ATP-binding protein [Kribbella solani]MBB5977278.1 oligopeptide/dipeptide ABC transporter ATP-binding protein [Kribbella solani]